MRRPCTFRQSDVTRAIRAAKAAGIAHPRVEIEPGGKIVVMAGPPIPSFETTKEWPEDATCN